jgi:AcrR family transcriptional regulator
MNERQPARERILSAATELIREEAAFEKVSMRRVADRAGVAVSMVNYHFQTKENLVNQAVQRFIGSVITESQISEGESEDHPADAMRRHLRSAATFVANNPGVSRVSILRDMRAPAATDNTSQVAEVVYRQLCALHGEEKGEKELRVLAQMQVAAVQQLFLRAPENKESIGLDFFDEEDRNYMVDILIDMMTGGAG